MTNDVKEAMERVKSGPAVATMADFAILARAYLAENDETEITYDWLRSVGFQDDDERPYLWINSGWERTPDFDLEAWNDGDWTVSDADNTLKLIPPKTRGDVIRLCAALGIPLKTAASEGGVG